LNNLKIENFKSVSLRIENYVNPVDSEDLPYAWLILILSFSKRLNDIARNKSFQQT